MVQRSERCLNVLSRFAIRCSCPEKASQRCRGYSRWEHEVGESYQRFI